MGETTVKETIWGRIIWAETWLTKMNQLFKDVRQEWNSEEVGELGARPECKNEFDVFKGPASSLAPFQFMISPPY